MNRRRPSRARLICLAISLSGLLCGAAEAATVRHAEPLLGLSGGASKPAAAGPIVLSFNAFSRDFALELEPNGRLAGLQRRVDTTAAYRGKIAGRSDSWVRLVLTPEGPSGLVFDGETLYGIEAGDDTTLAGGAPAMFRLADVYFAPGELGCEAGAAALDGEQVVAAMAQEFTALAAVAATRRLDLGAVADFEFSQAFGANAELELLTRFNNVDGIFSEQVGVDISVEKVDIFTASDDPFTASTANALLDELASYRGRTPSQEALGLTHLFTGRDLDGATAGIAFIGAVCATRRPPEPRSFGAGLSEGRRTAVLDSLLAAHEIGHNFGAPHDGAAACASTPSTGFLMAPNVIGSNQFSACSIGEMQAEIASATCLTRIGPADMRVRLPQPSQVFAGVSFAQAANVDNDGADEATGVVFTATAPTGLAIEAAASAGATCTVLPSSATCPLGTVGGGATRSVTLTLRAPAPGTFNLTAAVSAASDQNPGNNTVALALTAVPSVDLVWSGAASPVQLNAQATVTATLTNAADFAATSVTVTATMAVGLRADQATLGGSACTISTPTAVSCPPQTLAARASAPLVLTVTGMAAGSQQLTLNATATELERAPADNRLPLTINVSAPPSGGGGGGSMPWLAVAALLAAHGWRRTMRGRRRPS